MSYWREIRILCDFCDVNKCTVDRNVHLVHCGARPGEIDEETAEPGQKYTKAGFYIFSSAILYKE